MTKPIEALRSWMRTHGLTAYIFPSTDPHCGEYVPDHWKTREWISGFNGSAGTAVVTLTRAALWTDSRYWLAADEQLAGTPFEVVRCGRNVATPEELVEWIARENEQGGFKVGFNAWVNTVDTVKMLEQELDKHGLGSCADLDPATELWQERPALPRNPIEIQPLQYAGRTAKDKLTEIRQYMKDNKVNALLVSQLDEIAWTLNLRGTDVHCTPVFVAYLLILDTTAILYIDECKLTDEVRTYLKSIDVDVKPYNAARIDASLRLMYDPSCTNAGIIRQLSQSKEVNLVCGKSPITLMLAVKNDAEIAGYRSAMHKDGVAMVKFLRWLEDEMKHKRKVTELDVCEKLRKMRSYQPLFRDISFDTIAGYGAHGAIVHYEPTPDTDITLEPHGLLLLDSGAQYQDGTTDITRTIPLGPLTDDERCDYTLVLKGHIRLAMTLFPEGTTGTQLDVLARYAMWQHCLNYGHGTGHGVGSYLSVHEGPHQFRMNWVPTPLQAGMTITIEPGIYIAGSHGVRHENTMLIKRSTESSWLFFEPLTLCPIATSPIVSEMMSDDEIEYLNQYHAHVRAELMPLLEDEADRKWLLNATQPYTRNSL